MREPVVPCLTRPPADRLDDDGEDGNAEDERGEVEMQLSHGPHGEARAEDGERAVRGILRRALSGRLRVGGKHGEHGDREADEDDQPDGTARKDHDGKTLSKDELVPEVT